MKYFARKFGFFLATLWAVVTLNFLIPRLQPGDPAEIMVKRLAGKDAPLDPAQVKAMRAMLGAPDGSLWQQYWSYLGELVHGNFGLSYTYYPFQVTEVIGQAFWWTVVLVTVAQVLSFVGRRRARGVCRVAAQLALRLRRDAGVDVPRHAAARSGSRCCCSTSSATASAGSRPRAATRRRRRAGTGRSSRRRSRTRSCPPWRCSSSRRSAGSSACATR